MLSPTNDGSTDNNGSNGTSSMTLPEYNNGWETYSTSDDTTSQSDSRPSTMDELIGSPGLSPISQDTDTDDNINFDQNTVISLNDTAVRLMENSDTEKESKSSEESSASPSDNEKDSQASLTEPSGTESAATVDTVELRHLKKTVKRLRRELDLEKDMVMQLRKKITLTNKDKLSQTSQFNDEMSLLKYENVALQAKLEEQSVHTEQLEYELTKVRRQLRQDKIYANQREQQDGKQLEDLKSRLTETHSKLAALEESHSTMKRENAEEIHKLKVEVEEKESVILRAGKDTEIARKENQKLSDFIKEQESTLKDMLEKIQATEVEVSTVNSQLAASNEELTNQKRVNCQQLEQLQELQEKRETLMSKLAEETSLADEQRSSIDLLEARSVQLEVALNDEKSVSGELRTALEHLRSEHNELETTLNQQRRDQSDTMHSLSRSEQELVTLKKQIQMEKDDKRDVVGKLKKQLDMHQEHMKKLREDLAVANKHQIYMEEISQKIVNDLQPLFNGFPSEAGETTDNISSATAKTASQDRTRNVLDTLYSTVARYKRRLTSLSEEKQKAKALCDSLTKEMKSYKDMLYDKEKAYDDCKDKLADMLRERDRIARESTEFEARSATLTVDVETSKAHNQTLQSQCHSLRQEITQLKGKYERDVDEKLLYLQHIHHLLTSDLDISQGQLLGSAGKLSWSELSTTVTERLAAVLTELCSLRCQVARLEETNRKGESAMESLREEHASKMDGISQQLSAAIERSSMQWKAERAQLDEHYNNMVNEHQHRQQIYKEQLEKSQRNAEEAWSKLRDSDEANRCLETEQLEIHENIALLEKRQRSLLCALALMTGCYFPLMKRVKELKEQRLVLTHQLDRFAAFKAHVGGLLQTLASDSTPNSPQAGHSYARLQFRKAVIVILAAGRLQKVSKRPGLCVKGEDNSLTMCWPAVNSGEDKSDSSGLSENWLVNWVTQVDLESTATSCTKDIFAAIDRPSEGSAFTKRGYLQSVISTCLSKLLRQLSLLYTEETTTSWSTYGYTGLPRTLSSQLTNGLHSSLAKVCESDRLSLTPAQSVATRLQERVLSFVQQLHLSEAERQRLKQSVAALEDARLQLKQYQEACSDLESELHSSRKQAEKLVSADKLQEVMSQLEQALDKERNAQVLLAEQSSKMKELTRRLEVEITDRDHMEQSAKFSLKTVNEELEGKLALVTNLGRQVATLEGERRSLHDNLYDAEHALKTAANDRQALSNYAETLATAFNKCTGDGSNADLNRVMLSGELIPTGCTAPGLLSVQRLAQSFVDSYTALQAKVNALNTVTTEQLQEINRLKQELSLVCTGQAGYTQQPHNQVYQYPSSGYASSLSPLKISSDFSPVRRSPAVLDVGLVKLSAPHSPHRMSSSKGAPSPRLQMNGNMRR